VGVNLTDFPAGAIITPRVEFPPGWSPGDPLPAGSAAPPATAPETPGSSVVPPFYLAPGSPIYPRSDPAPAGVVTFFHEQFDDLVANSWTDLSALGGSASIVDGRLKLEGGGSDGRGQIRRVESQEFPDNFSAVAAITYDSGSDNARMEVRTGTYRIRLILTPPDTVGVLARISVDDVNVGNYLDSEIVWQVACSGSTGTVYMNGTPVIEDFELFVSSSGAGRNELTTYGPGLSFWDYFLLTVD